ncbi:MAG: SDR family NAD(P)-dependent oxidoreductase [Clostridia bacterium]|nr:SDR family NAD(P)-dependent oxidoreductase [Clostridia bacterium]
MKNIAIITGASSGMGKEFAKTIEKGGRFDEVWLIARRKDNLEKISSEIPFPVKILPFDLTDRENLKRIEEMLKEEAPAVSLLINCSGFGKFSATCDNSIEVNLNMMDLNCGALMATCQMCIPYMPKGSHIINIASVASVQPIPYINVYGATKAFVLSFSRALNREMKSRGITVTAVMPFWTKTEFFDRAVAEDNKVVKKYVAMYMPSDIVSRAWRDAYRGRDVSKYGFIARSQMLLAKILPHSFVMSFWMHQQKLK